jgi:hypothetical protein
MGSDDRYAKVALEQIDREVSALLEAVREDDRLLVAERKARGAAGLPPWARQLGERRMRLAARELESITKSALGLFGGPKAPADLRKSLAAAATEIDAAVQRWAPRAGTVPTPAARSPAPAVQPRPALTPDLIAGAKRRFEAAVERRRVAEVARVEAAEEARAKAAEAAKAARAEAARAAAEKQKRDWEEDYRFREALLKVQIRGGTIVTGILKETARKLQELRSRPYYGR